jgi:hypothetical protein
MRVSVPIVLLSTALAQQNPQNPRLPSILARVSEEAEVFTKIAPQVLATETLHQRALPVQGRRFIPRIGNSGNPPPPRMREREIISEYGFSSLREAPGAIREFRQVTSVDGRQVAAPEKARQTLATGLSSDDDRRRKQMLETFEKYGLIGTASDFGQVLLLFSRRGLENYTFELSGSTRLGADTVLIVNYKQQKGPEALTVFEKGMTLHQNLQGQIWVRESDFVPLRITLIAVRTENGKSTRRDEASVDYAMSSHGVILPAIVVHREFANGSMVAENTFQYSIFKRFGAASEIKFTTEEGDAGTGAKGVK